MDEKNQNQQIDDLIAFLDGRMAKGGSAVKPKFDGSGKMVAEEPKLFSDGLEEECPTCANIPNMMIRPDNEGWDGEEGSDF